VGLESIKQQAVNFVQVGGVGVFLTLVCVRRDAPSFQPSLPAWLSSLRQDIVELRRFHLAGAGEVGRLNYIFIGNPGTGKVRGQSVIYLFRLFMHDMASHVLSGPPFYRHPLHVCGRDCSANWACGPMQRTKRRSRRLSQMRLPQLAPHLSSQTTSARETPSL